MSREGMTSGSPRIALLTPYEAPDSHGGVETFNAQLQKALGDVEVIAHSERSPTSTAGGLGLVGLEQPYRGLRVAQAFLRRHRARPFDLAISNGLCGWPLFPGLSIPRIQVFHFTMAGLARNALTLQGDRLATRIVSAFFDRLAARGKDIVAVSETVREEVARYYGFEARVIPNAVDTELFRPLNQKRARNDLGLPSEGVIGLFVGRAHHAKGFDILLEVAGSMDDILFIHVGTPGGQSKNLKSFDEVSHSKMPLFYSAADFFFLPSRYEGLNLSILEALSCDRPIVTSTAAYPFSQDPSRYGYVAESLAADEFISGIRDVVTRSLFKTRDEIVAAYSLEVFQDNWRRFVNGLLEQAGTRLLRGVSGG